MLGLFIGYFVPKLSGDFARLFREAPQLFAKVNQEWLPRAGAWIDTHFGAEEVEPGRRRHTAAEPLQAPRAIHRRAAARRTLPDRPRRGGLEVRPLENGKYLIAPPALEESSRPAAAESGSARSSSGSPSGSSRPRARAGACSSTARSSSAAVVSGIGRLFLVLMVAAFILVDLDRIQGFLRSLVPEQLPGRLRPHRTSASIAGLSGVIRGQLVICLINGVLTYIGLWLFKVKYPLLLAGIAATMSLIPIFGSILSSVPIVAIALISSGTFDLKQGVLRARLDHPASTWSRRTSSTRRSWATPPRFTRCWWCSR